MRNLLLVVFAVSSWLWHAAASSAQAPDDWIMYVGTYTRAPSKGIYAYRFQGATGEVTPLGDRRPRRGNRESLVSRRSSEPAVSLRGERGLELRGRPAGSVSAFSIDRATGTLTLLNRVSSRGGSPCHLSVDQVRQVALRRELRRRQRRRLPGAGRWEAGRGVGVLSARRLEREQGAPERPARARRGRLAGQPVRAGRGSRAGQGVRLPARPDGGGSRRASRRFPRSRRDRARATWSSGPTASSPTC